MFGAFNFHRTSVVLSYCHVTFYQIIFTFPNRDRSGIAMLPFWPEEASTNEKTDLKGGEASTKLGTVNKQRKPHIDALAHLPDI